MQEVKKVKVKHFHQNKNDYSSERGRLMGTLVYTVNDNGTFDAAYSVVNPADNPNRKLGVHIAVQRLNMAQNKTRFSHAKVGIPQEVFESLFDGGFLERALTKYGSA